MDLHPGQDDKPELVISTAANDPIGVRRETVPLMDSSLRSE